MQDDFESVYKKGILLFQTHHYEEAIAAFRLVPDIHPEFPDVHLYLGRSLLGMDMPDQAIQEFQESLRIHPDDGNSRYWLAISLMNKDRSDETLHFLCETIRQEPDELPHFTQTILEMFRRKCTFLQTEEFFRTCAGIFEALKKSGHTGESFSCAHAHIYGTLGQLYFEKGLLNEAMIKYREALLIYPKNPSFHAKLADIYVLTNLFTDAISEYRVSLRYNPDDAAIHKDLGDALIKTGQFIDAFNEYREAVHLEPGNQNYMNTYTRFRQILISHEEGGTTGQPALQPQSSPLGLLSKSLEAHFNTIIAAGESESVEFKSSALWSKSFSNADIAASDSREVHKFGKDASKIIIAKTIAGFLNTNGGNLVIGIQENKEGKDHEIMGIEADYPKLKDPCTDGYRRMVIDEIIRKYLPSEMYHHLNQYLRMHFPKTRDKTLCWMEIKKADDGIFIKVQDEEHFFIRVDAETRQISDRALVDYCRKHFR